MRVDRKYRSALSPDSIDPLRRFFGSSPRESEQNLAIIPEPVDLSGEH